MARKLKLLVIGAGAIGSHLCGFLGRMPVAVGSVTVVDFDCFESHNLANQEIGPEAVGRPKAEVQAERIRALSSHGGIESAALVCLVEEAGLGYFKRSDLVVGALDRIDARISAQMKARFTGVPYLDLGVRAPGLARASAFAGEGGACWACGITDRTRVSIPAPCALAAATPTPAFLAACAATLAAHEIETFAREGNLDAPAEIVVSLPGRAVWHTKLARRAGCLACHEPWPGTLESLDLATPVSELCARGEEHAKLVGGGTWAEALTCSRCGRREAAQVVWRRSAAEPCQCGGEMLTAPMDASLSADLAAVEGRRSLAELGFRPLDWIWFDGRKAYELVA